MAIIEKRQEEQNPSQAPTLGMGSGTFGQQAQQRTNIAQGGSGRFTNLQQYIKANEANPNAQLLQREGTRRQEELGARQQEFTKQAEPIKQQFEGIRSGQQFVQSALQDPTKIVQDPKNIERFSQYRTQGIGDVEAPFQQLQAARGTLGTQQEQLASGLETIQKDPNALQNFLQSQRDNPSLATRGENVLDRFLTQSTESGQKAIAGLGTTAGVIRGTQAPSIIQDVESLRGQIQGQPLTAGEVQNVLSQQITPEENYIRNIDPDAYIGRQIGLTSIPNVSLIQSVDQNQFPSLPVLQYNRPTTINENVDNEFIKKRLERARTQYNQYQDFKNEYNQIKQALDEAKNNPDFFERQRLSMGAEEGLRRILDKYSGTNIGSVPYYEEYLKYAGKPIEELFGALEKDRYNRLLALRQLGGIS